MSRGSPIHTGDLVKVQGGMVFIGQTGVALEDALHGSGKIKVQFDGYAKQHRIDASRLVVTGKGELPKATAPEKAPAYNTTPEAPRESRYEPSPMVLQRKMQQRKEEAKQAARAKREAKARAALIRINKLSDLEQSEDEELSYIEGEKRRELEQRRRKQAFWA